MGILSGKVVIVTGGARGIGRSHCLELARQGAAVIVNDVSPERLSIAEEIRSHGGVATDDATSVRDFAAVGTMITRTIERHGRLDALVNNAAVLHNSVIVRSPEDQWDEVLEVNLKGTFALAHHAAAYWRDQHKAGHPVSGRVVNTVSGAGLFGSVGQASYGASKAAIANFTATAALELHRYGVTVNAISPSARTDMTKGLAGMPEAPDSTKWDPLDPANSSPVVAWLVSDRSEWLTGALLRVRGNTVFRIRPWSLDTESAYTARGSQRLTVEELDDGMRQLFGTGPATPPSSW